jgi:YbbR domain-containing protein
MAKRDWILKDFGWKLFSLILAVTLWITIRHSIGESPTTVIPFASVDTVTFTNLPVLAVSSNADVHNAQVNPRAIAIKLTGPSEVMAVLEENKIHATVNLTGVDLASGLPLLVDVSVPPGITIDKITPPKVNVTFSPPTE